MGGEKLHFSFELSSHTHIERGMGDRSLLLSCGNFNLRGVHLRRKEGVICCGFPISSLVCLASKSHFCFFLLWPRLSFIYFNSSGFPLEVVSSHKQIIKEWKQRDFGASLAASMINTPFQNSMCFLHFSRNPPFFLIEQDRGQKWDQHVSTLQKRVETEKAPSCRMHLNGNKICNSGGYVISLGGRKW